MKQSRGNWYREEVMSSAGIFCLCGTKARAWIRLDPKKGTVLHAECPECKTAELAYKDELGEIVIEKEPQMMMQFM
jgi:hypothetical protein